MPSRSNAKQDRQRWSLVQSELRMGDSKTADAHRRATKLTEEIVAEIRRQDYTIPISVLARTYGVGDQTIRAVLSGEVSRLPYNARASLVSLSRGYSYVRRGRLDESLLSPCCIFSRGRGGILRWLDTFRSDLAIRDVHVPVLMVHGDGFTDARLCAAEAIRGWRRDASRPAVLLQCFHQINYPYRRPLPWFLDPLTALFPLDQFAKHLLVAILEFFRLEVASFRGDDVCGKVQHLFREFHVRQVTEIIRLLADLVGIMELMPKRPLARGSIAMTCSQVVSTTLPSATMSAFLIASRITA
jgi:hypothetical protein